MLRRNPPQNCEISYVRIGGLSNKIAEMAWPGGHYPVSNPLRNCEIAQVGIGGTFNKIKISGKHPRMCPALQIPK